MQVSFSMQEACLCQAPAGGLPSPRPRRGGAVDHGTERLAAGEIEGACGGRPAGRGTEQRRRSHAPSQNG